MCVCLADAERLERLNENVKRAKQQTLKQGKQLGLQTSWKVEDAAWKLDVVKQAKETLAAQLQDAEYSVQQLQEQLVGANSVIHQLATDREEVSTKARQLEEKVQHAEQHAKAAAAATTFVMEARDKGIQELSQAQTQIHDLKQVHEKLIEEHEQMVPFADEACKLRRNMEQNLAESKHFTTAAFDALETLQCFWHHQCWGVWALQQC